MSNKRGLKTLGIAALSCLCLTACDEIIAKTTDYDDPIVSSEEYSEVYNNVLNIVYDALRDGSLASDVVDEVLYEYAKSVFGPYNAVITADDTTAVTLKSVVADIESHTNEETGVVSGVSTTTDQFIIDHKAYWSTNNEDERIGDDTEPVSEDAAPSQGEYARVVAKWDTIEERISETMYSTISSGSYSFRSLFKEEELLMSLYGGFNKVASPLEVTDLTESLIYPNIDETEVFEEIDGIATTPLLHREYYQSNYALDATESASDPYTYVEDNIIPSIYRDLLTEQYLLDESYNTLGRTYARKVNIVAISDNSDHQESAAYLMDAFVKNYLDVEPDTTDITTSTNKVELETFEMLSNAWRGIGVVEDELSEEEITLLEAAGFTTVESWYGHEDEEEASGSAPYSSYLGTNYGDLIEKINKLDDNLYITDTSVESELTGGSSYPISTGIEIQKNNIRLESYTTDGWYIKNGGLGTLPDSIRDRLFNISVANAIQEGDEDGLKEHDRWQYENGSWTYTKEADVNNYVAQINGKYYLKNVTSESSSYANPSSDVLWYDRDSGTYYIVQIEEAISSSKLSKTSDHRYAATRGNDVMEDTVNQVAKIVASDSSYVSLSTEWWLEQATLNYHDDVVYDYFYANYPDLFDD